MKHTQHKDSQISIQELATQLIDTLSVALYYAGVKRDKLEDALESYEELLDSLEYDDESPYGIDEMIKTIESLRQSHKELFANNIPKN
ncbi:hypothetical protein [uncultured Helicobacter sp.]|uniref:hypothetical protein n=1 Tax=uncultured Helicobacter sp. TaxID=175537 RepID=UPI00374F1A98